MDRPKTSTRTLWDRFLATRSDEHRTALVEYYTPMVQMQTAIWAYGLQARQRTGCPEARFDGLAEPAGPDIFLPFVPPLAGWGRPC